jgi:hypothetical protein
MLTYYAPTFIDESMTLPDKRGNQRPTGRLSGMVFTRRFSRTRGGRIKAERGVISFSWKEDTQEAKAAALAKVIEGMEGELPELDSNPPTNFIPAIVKEKLS